MRTQFPQLASERVERVERSERPLIGNSARTAERRRRERERERDAERERQRALTIPENSPRVSMSTNSSSRSSSFLEDNEHLPQPAPPTRTNSSTSSLPAPSSGPMVRTMASRSLSETTAHTLHPSIEPETGKWQPYHQWGPLYDMQYAKRCMAILTERSPRKNNFLVMKGRLWVVDWATGRVERLEPPAYGEIDSFSSKGRRPDKLAPSRLRINQQGELVAV